jgi:hypothetical protein
MYAAMGAAYWMSLILTSKSVSDLQRSVSLAPPQPLINTNSRSELRSSDKSTYAEYLSRMVELGN